ncbi:MAG: hypothetical protein G01um101470_421 [Parcubacteria group bacterium Gr01-1014_70]|nr:MAG: hypothetical protein G01um101470_421 [Parcubacteria group bacterium Gr01-1014_70]
MRVLFFCGLMFFYTGNVMAEGEQPDGKIVEMEVTGYLKYPVRVKRDNGTSTEFVILESKNIPAKVLMSGVFDTMAVLVIDGKEVNRKELKKISKEKVVVARGKYYMFLKEGQKKFLKLVIFTVPK